MSRRDQVAGGRLLRKSNRRGLLAGVAVIEYGRHDITPGVGGEPSGYLVFTLPGGDIAYVKWLVHAVFVPGPDGKPKLLDNGVWELVSGTGKLKGLKGPERPISRRSQRLTENTFLRESWHQPEKR